MHHVRLDVAPFHAPFLDLRPQRVAVADHRQIVMAPHLGLPFLGIAAVLVHGKEKQNGGLVRLAQDLPDEAFQRLGGGLSVRIVNRVFHHDKVGMVRQQIALGAQGAVVRAGRSDPGVDESDTGLGERLPPPGRHTLAVAVLGFAGRGSLRNRAPDDADRDRFSAPRFGQRVLQPGRIARADQAAGKQAAFVGFGTLDRVGEDNDPAELEYNEEEQHRQGQPWNRSET
jgi:hypothetical protein